MKHETPDKLYPPLPKGWIDKALVLTWRVLTFLIICIMAFWPSIWPWIVALTFLAWLKGLK